MHGAHSLTHNRDSVSGSEYCPINGSIIRRPNDSALETSSLVVDMVDSGGTCLYCLLAVKSHELPGPGIPRFQNSSSKNHLTGHYAN